MLLVSLSDTFYQNQLMYYQTCISGGWIDLVITIKFISLQWNWLLAEWLMISLNVRIINAKKTGASIKSNK